MWIGFGTQSELGPLSRVKDRDSDGERALRRFVAKILHRDRVIDLAWSPKRSVLIALCARRNLYGWVDLLVIDGLVQAEGSPVVGEVTVRPIAMDPAIWLMSRTATWFGATLFLPLLAFAAIGMLTGLFEPYGLYDASPPIRWATLAVLVFGSLAHTSYAIRRGPSRDAILAEVLDWFRSGGDVLGETPEDARDVTQGP